MATIEFTCPACGRKLGVDSSYAGKPGTCPGCGGKVQIPAASAVGGAPAGSPAPASTSGAAAQAPRSIRPAAPAIRASSSSRRRGALAPKTEREGKQPLILIGGGVAVLAIIVVVGLLVFTGGGGAGTDSELLRYVPADAPACGYFNLSEIARSGLLDSVLRADEHNEFAAMLKKMKLDPKKDLREAVIVGDASNDPTFILSGNFDAGAIYEGAKEAGGTVDVDYKGYAAIEDGDDSLLAVINDGTLLVGGYKPVAQKVLDVLKGDAPAIAEDSPILQRAKKASGKTFWISVDLEDYDTSETPQLLPGVDAAQVEYMVISGSVKSSGIAIEVHSGCPDAEAAEAAAKGAEEGIRGFMGMMAMFSADESEGGKAVKRTLDSIKVDSSGDTFTISLTLSAEMITVFASSAEADDDAPMTFDDGDDTFGDDIDEPSDTNEPATGTVADPFELDELDGPPPIKSTGDIEPEKEE